MMSGLLTDLCNDVLMRAAKALFESSSLDFQFQPVCIPHSQMPPSHKRQMSTPLHSWFTAPHNEAHTMMTPRAPAAVTLLLTPTSGTTTASAISVFTPRATAATPSPHLHTSVHQHKLPTRFPFDSCNSAVASPDSASLSAMPVSLLSHQHPASMPSSPFKVLRSPAQPALTPAAHRRHSQSSALTADQQALQQFILSSPWRRMLTWSPTSATAADDAAPTATQLQSLLSACMIEDSTIVCGLAPAAPSSSASEIAISLLRYVSQLQLTFHSLAELTQTLQKLTAQAQRVVQEIASLLRSDHQFDHDSLQSHHTHTAAWSILLQSGAGIDSPFFLRLLSSQRPVTSPLSNQPPPLPPRSPSLSELVSMLQSFVRHYTQETRDPLVGFIQQHQHQLQRDRCSPQPQLINAASLRPMDSDCMRDDDAPAATLSTSLRLQLDDGPASTAAADSPSSSFFPTSLTSLVHGLFMRVGPVYIDKLSGIIRAQLQSISQPIVISGSNSNWNQIEAAVMKQLQ